MHDMGDGNPVYDDYTKMWSDTYVAPCENDRGIYLLEEPEREKLYRDDRLHPLSNVRMREPAVRYSEQDAGYDTPLESYTSRPVRKCREGCRENFRINSNRDESDWAREYRDSIPGQQILRSRRRGYGTIMDVNWDPRPPGFRADDGPVASAFVPPPGVRPPRGGIITPWETSYAPTNSEAVIRQNLPDPNMNGLAPCGALPQPWSKENFSHRSGDMLTHKTLTLGIQMVKIVLFFILVILIATWIAIGVCEKRVGSKVREMVLELRDLMRSSATTKAT